MTQPHPAEQRLTVGTLLLTIAHLAFYGAFGWLAILLLLLLVLGVVVTLPLFGLGLVLIILPVHWMIALASLENARVQTLYGLPRSSLPRVARGDHGWLRALLRQSVAPGLWRSFGSFLLACLFGGLSNLALVYSLSTFSSSESWGTPLLLTIAALLAMPVFAYVHATISINLVGRSRRELAAAAEASLQQREGAIRAAAVERTRIERDLHDGVQPRLVSIGMTLGLAQTKIDTDPAAARELVIEAHASTKSAITELRQLARGIYASVLTDRGLDAALSALAARSHVPVELDVRLPQRSQVDNPRYREVEAAAYFLIGEALTNAAKYSGATAVRVQVRLYDLDTQYARLWVRVEDNGVGGAVVQPGGGLDGIGQRVRAAGGMLRFSSPSGGPTSLEANLPCVF